MQPCSGKMSSVYPPPERFPCVTFLNKTRTNINICIIGIEIFYAAQICFCCSGPADYVR